MNADDARIRQPDLQELVRRHGGCSGRAAPRRAVFELRASSRGYSESGQGRLLFSENESKIKDLNHILNVW